MFMFQPGEEGWHGARFMLEDGLHRSDPGRRLRPAHLAQHAARRHRRPQAGPLLASSDKIRIKVIGKGGHASMPQDALDPIPIACEIVMALQALVTRRISVADPAVITIARIEAGTTDNIIPEVARLLGHHAAPSPSAPAPSALEGIERVAANIAAGPRRRRPRSTSTAASRSPSTTAAWSTSPSRVATRLFGDGGLDAPWAIR